MNPNIQYSYQPQQQESVSHLPHKNLLLGLIGIVLLSMMGIFFLITNRQTQTNTVILPTPTPSNTLDTLQSLPKKEGEYYSSATSPALKNPPKTQFTYTLNATPPIVPPSASQFMLSSNLNTQQASIIAQKFGITTTPQPIGLNNYFFFDETKGNQVIVYGNSGAIIANFNSQTSPTPIITSDTQALEKAKEYLQRVNLWEESFTTPMGNPYPKNAVVYKKDTYPNTYFVEFHRGWTEFPIIYHVGMLNDTFKNSLANPKKSLAPNKNISYSSDGLSGYERSDSFNTVTVGVRTDGTIEYLQYYLRTIESTKQVNIKPFQDALNELMQGTATDVLIYPTGKLGSHTDYTKEEWQALFPAGIALSKDAVVDDVQLVYNEKPITETQNTMNPTYVFRGKAVLTNGTIVTFVSLVNAVQ